MTQSRLRVVIDARLQPGYNGGVGQVVIGLAHGLSELEGPEEYLFLTVQGEDEWLRPHLAGACSAVAVPKSMKSRLKAAAPWLADVRHRVRKQLSGVDSVLRLPCSDGTAERLGAQVIHFPRQDGFVTQIPSVFQPHDLQHVHLPEFFGAEELTARDTIYRALATQAAMVSVTSHWGARDLVENLDVPADKIAVIPLAPALAAYGRAPSDDEREKILARLGVTQRPYAFYPAQTWPHKNHIRLAKAIGLLARKGLDVCLVCTGGLNDHFTEVSRAVDELGLSGRIKFLGFVDERDMQALYSGARCLVMPTLFEAAGGFGPIAEAFLAGVPVACSNVTSLPEQVGEDALVFDPYDEQAIADSVERLWLDSALRERLVRGGHVNVSRFSWRRTALTFRAHYRRLAGQALSEEDEAIIHQATEF